MISFCHDDHVIYHKSYLTSAISDSSSSTIIRHKSVIFFSFAICPSLDSHILRCCCHSGCLDYKLNVLLSFGGRQLLQAGPPTLKRLGNNEPTRYPFFYQGESRLVHIVPSGTPVLARPFIAQVRRCEEALHKMGNL